MTVKQAQSLLSDIKKKRSDWDERSQSVMRGVKNLSCADLNMLELYAETFVRTSSLSGLMKPLGSIALVLEKYGVQESCN